MKPVTVMVVEDHFLARIALRGLLDAVSGFQIVAESTSGQEAIDQYREKQPDVVIMDLRLNGLSGFEAIECIAKQYPKARILVLSSLHGSEDVYRAIRCGARGYVTKDVEGPELSKALRVVAAGGRYINEALELRMEERPFGNDLTPKELAILELLASGLSTVDIGTTCQIAEKTVRIHISNILEKLGARDRTQAVVIALRRGIIHFDK
jgi:DNA-binding NarL/FixJ family response regulator